MAEDLRVGEMLNRLMSSVVSFDEGIGFRLGLKKEVERLRVVLMKIQAVLQDAEIRQTENEAVRRWLKVVRETFYDAEDLLDEIAYEDLRPVDNKVLNFFSASNPILLNFKFANKIQDINETLDDLAKARNVLQLKSSYSYDDFYNYDRETLPIVDDSTVVGREVDKSKIVNMLIGDGSSSSASDTLSVIPIVGMGGIGKTTLAQLVYNDEAVKRHFDLIIWICVADKFVVRNLFAQICEQISYTTKLESSDKLELHLQTYLAGKRFLLVLDDVWNEDSFPEKWADFTIPLKKCGAAAGSKMIITTRDKTVALIVGAQDMYELQTLAEEDCFTLFESRAFMLGGPEKTPLLEAIGKEIVNKCGGLPLAAKVLGGLMHSKRTKNEWLVVRDSETWNMLHVESRVIGALKLSYDNLSPSLRQCFSYCSIFPKGYEIQKDTLIQLWMAQGFLKTSRGAELMEDIGDEYFRILCSNSFFQDIQKNELGDIETCKMHNLVHYLAQSVTGSECQTLEATMLENRSSDSRHLALIFNERDAAISQALYKMKKMRTFLTFSIPNFVHDLYLYTGSQKVSLPSIFNLKLLRVLDLSDLMVEVLPASIGGLKHLRYLNLSHSRIEVLPHTIIELYNLQTLILEECHRLQRLPENVGNLINLRHLYVDNSGNWKETPWGLVQLTYLQTLPILKLCHHSAGSHIAELENLDHLRGMLDIYGLEHVKDVVLAEKANLIKKKNLKTLRLHGNDWRRRFRNSTNEVDNDFNDAVLEALQPHPNLKEIEISGFQGVKFPYWMTNGSLLSSLVKLNVRDCNKCEHIKSFGDLPSLEELKIQDMRNMKCLGNEGIEKAKASSVAYPYLKKLTLHCIPKLEKWLENKFLRCFPRLEVLSLTACPNLKKTPNQFPSLQNLVLEKVGGVGLSLIISCLASLVSFTIKGSEDLSFLLDEGLRKSNHLERLEIRDCHVIKSIPDISGFPLLRELSISDCEELETIGEEHLNTLPALEMLHIDHCRKLRISATDPFPRLRGICVSNINDMVICDAWASKMSSLVEISIGNIPELRELPVKFLQNNKHLQKVNISACPKFRGFLLSEKEEEQLLHTSSLETSLETIRLRELRVCSCKGLESLEGLQFLGNIEKLRLGPFSEELDHFPFPAVAEISHLASTLRELHVTGWYNLSSMPQQFEHLRALNFLLISDFDGLTALPEWLGGFALLDTLIIRNCKNLMHLPSENGMQRLTSLKALFIDKCPLLQRSCNSRVNGQEWHKISHIPHVHLGVHYHALD